MLPAHERASNFHLEGMQERGVAGEGGKLVRAFRQASVTCKVPVMITFDATSS
jgi:hypothetical protein